MDQETTMDFKHEHLTRQLELIPLDVLGQSITIIGAGAVGSFTALSLAKMGFDNITVYDFDKIEIENMNCQFYPMDAVGRPKVEALKDLIKLFTKVEIDARNEKYEDGQFPGIVISAVDSMAVRKRIWDNHKMTAILTKLIIDPRMGAEQALAYAMNPMNPQDIKSYEKTLYDDKDAVQERCTAKSTMYTSLALASHVCKIVKDFVCKDRYARIMEWNIASNTQQCFMSRSLDT